MRIFISHIIAAAALLLMVAACATSRPAVDAAPEASADSILAFRVFLVGGTGHSPSDAKPVLDLLRSQLQDESDRSVVVFLGDNVERSGLPDSGSTDRRRIEAQLEAQIDAVRDFPGRVVFIPGDYDWAAGGADGFEAALRQERFVEAALGKRPKGRVEDIFLPDAGLPGPEVVKLSDNVVLLAINTQWWLHPSDKPYGDEGEVDLELDEDFLLELADELEEYRKETVLIVGHHPIASSGPRSGRYPWESHLFPLRELHRSAYVPLPLVGSLPFLYVQHFGGSRQDLAHPRYASLRDHLTRIFDQHDRLIYASAHERSLQYLKTNGRVDPRGHMLISGSASGAAHTANDSRFDLAAGEPGFMVLDFYQEGSVSIEAWTTGRGRIYRGELEGPEPDLRDPLATSEQPKVDYRDSVVTIAANPNFASGRLHEIFFGRHYRREWAAPVGVPVLDLSREAGGLTLLRRGGGVQTASLRFKGGDGVEYVARTVDKDPRRTLPEHLRSALVEKVVLDFNSSLHPYGALMVPRLAEAAGVYHTNPRFRVIPDDPRLGRHREEFAGRLMLFEERPDEDLSDFESFGFSENVIGTPKLYEEIDDDNDHRVDQRAFVRARLFDMLLADWDRHWDQWRWASFEPADSVGKIYRPVPRDRDWAFARFEGIIPSLLQYVMPKFQGFGDHYGDLRALNHAGKSLDRRFTAALTKSDWLEIADSVRAALTDDVIENAVRGVPEQIFQERGEETIRILKNRRDALPTIAEKYYRLNARVVDVVASNKHERFEVSDAPGGATRVVVYKTSKEGEIRTPIYDRTFLSDETREIRLYGQGGRDRFILNGSSSRIRVRAIGGAGEDYFANSGPSERPRSVLYDTDTGNTWEVGPRTSARRSDDPAINLYDRGFEYDQLLPVVSFGTNNTDGIVFGGGAQIIRHGFRKSPYAHAHRITASFATQTQGIELDYSGHFTSTLGSWNTGLDVDARTPNNVRNFYGLGNETLEDARARVNFGSVTARPFAERKLGASATFRIGPTVEFVRVSEADDEPSIPQLEGITYGDQWTAGLDANFRLDGRNDAVNPTQGVLWNTTLDLRAGDGDAHEVYSTAKTVFSVYASPRHSPQITFAVRAGGSHILGEYPFYAASTLGGDDNLRGYRSNRFGGRSSLFQNVEARVELFKFSTYVVPGHLGVLGFLDNGRVWLDDEPSSQWHQTYGGGLWVRVFERFIATGTYGWSDESSAFVLKTGFQF